MLFSVSFETISNVFFSWWLWMVITNIRASGALVKIDTWEKGFAYVLISSDNVVIYKTSYFFIKKIRRVPPLK